jgi:hypothetical protein
MSLLLSYLPTELIIAVATLLDARSLVHFELVRLNPRLVSFPIWRTRLTNLATDVQGPPRCCQERYFFAIYACTRCAGIV